MNLYQPKVELGFTHQSPKQLSAFVVVFKNIIGGDSSYFVNQLVESQIKLNVWSAASQGLTTVAAVLTIELFTWYDINCNGTELDAAGVWLIHLLVPESYVKT